VPIGLNQQGKSIYLRIPEDYEGQFWGGLAWELMRGRVTGKEGAISLTAEQSPYRLHPLLEVSSDLFQYYVRGINPLDEYRGGLCCRIRYSEQEAPKPISRWASMRGGILVEPFFTIRQAINW